ncbi:IS110 family RNA-guided transposase [Dysosmobacter welbionis]|uniref:IS110 family transposase n=1 Tax=Dysosmobacter welbionis TaxID=2093857 RepID=UPI00307BE1D5
MTAVGIDVSKGKSVVAARRPGGEVILPPTQVNHTAEELAHLVDRLRKIGGDIRIVMEHTGMYWRPIAHALKEAGFFVSVVNAILIHNFSNNSLRKVKTDKADALKIANYCLAFWTELRNFSDEDETRQMLKMQCRLYERTQKTSVELRNGLISLLDQTFPGINKVLPSPYCSKRGHYKWVDFVKTFWHKDCVKKHSLNAFSNSYQRWCKKEGYRFREAEAEKIYNAAQNAVATFPANESTELLIVQAVDCLNAVYESKAVLRAEMRRLASLLPEYEVVMTMQGAGDITGPKLMAEIGDVRRFTSKRALVAFAGVDAPPFQLRRTLFQIMSVILQHSSLDNAVYLFMDKKRAEGKHFYVYMVAGAAKFLRIYYARVKEYLAALEVGKSAA